VENPNVCHFAVEIIPTRLLRLQPTSRTLTGQRSGFQTPAHGLHEDGKHAMMNVYSVETSELVGARKPAGLGKDEASYISAQLWPRSGVGF
jgi:hypothetical protein